MESFDHPIPLRNRRGDIRKVGIELEFSGMSLREAAEAVQDAFGGELHQEHDYRHHVDVPSLGKFEVAFDSSLLSDKKYESIGNQLGRSVGGLVKDGVEAVLNRMGDAVLPLEISTPPIPTDRLGNVTKLEKALRSRGAQGTRAHSLSAFALHFNSEACDPADPSYVVRVLRAFLLLYEWLFRQAQVDWMRRALPFINPFPKSYTRRVIDSDYAPSMEQLIDDYVEANPTRNRPLDLLPLFASYSGNLTDRVELKGQKVKPRPTFHYRLPNSMIDERDWSIAREWNHWVLIERLAASEDLMNRLSQTYRNWNGSLIDYLNDRWVKHLEEDWLPLIRESSTNPENAVNEAMLR